MCITGVGQQLNCMTVAPIAEKVRTRVKEKLLGGQTGALYFFTTSSQRSESVSGFEILAITFSFIVGLGMAQVLQSVAYVVREKGQIRLRGKSAGETV